MSDALHTLTVPLKHGIKIGERFAKSVVIREPVLDDMIAAEEDANSSFSPIAYRRALVARQIVSLDGQTLPVTPEMLGRLKSGDWKRLVQGLNEAEALGEADSGDASAS